MEEFEHVIRDTPLCGQESADEEYDAGYAARFHDEADCGSATANWRAGWSDADRDLAKTEEEGIPTQAPLRFFESGSLARRCGLPFDPFSSEEWKRDWVEADVAIGITRLTGRQERG